MARLTGAILATLAALACTPASTENVGSVLSASAEITLRRHTLGGNAFSPRYELVFRGDGRVTFRGFHGVLNKGPVEASVDAGRVRELWFRLLEEPALKPGYRRVPGSNLCNSHCRAFDLHVRHSEAAEPVLGMRNAAGCASEAESQLEAIVESLESLFDTRSLIGTTEQVRQKMTNEMRRRDP